MTAHLLPSSHLPSDTMDTFHPSYLDEIANAVRGPAVQLAIDMRIEQIVKYGHDAEHDAMQAIDALPRLAAERLIHARDQILATGERRNLPVAKLNLARAAAMCLAAIDRIDVVLDAESKKQRELGL